MAQVKKTNGYKRRITENPGRDRYGNFREGRQVSADNINGRRLMHDFKAGRSV